MFNHIKTTFKTQIGLQSWRTGGIRFTPHRGLELRCDFQGYRAGEIGDKVRPAIVVSAWELNGQTAYVVPVSQADLWATSLDICLAADRYPFFTAGVEQWAKVQLLTHVEHARLDRMQINGRWCTPTIDSSDLSRVLAALASIFTISTPHESGEPLLGHLVGGGAGHSHGQLRFLIMRRLPAPSQVPPLSMIRRRRNRGV